MAVFNYAKHFGKAVLLEIKLEDELPYTTSKAGDRCTYWAHLGMVENPEFKGTKIYVIIIATLTIRLAIGNS